MINLGLMFDVDGPLASPETRSIRIPSIIDNLVCLVGAGVPIAFVTGRSSEFIRLNVIGPLLIAGLGEALGTADARMFGVFEKGGSWAPITSAGMSSVEVDDSVAFTPSVVEAVRQLVSNRFSGTMFFDAEKVAMISVEQRTDVTSAVYLAEQAVFNDAAFELLVAHGVGVRLGERVHADALGRVPFRLDPTIISTDIESVQLDKDRGAERALDYFASLGPLPNRWVSIGDSRGDYLMADHLHAAGYDAAHLDVRPLDGMLVREYAVLTEGDKVHDEATAVFLERWILDLGLRPNGAPATAAPRLT